MSNLTLESMLATIRQCQPPAPLDRWILVNKDDLARMYAENPGLVLPNEVKPSEYVPRGRGYSIAKLDSLGFTELEHKLEFYRDHGLGPTQPLVNAFSLFYSGIAAATRQFGVLAGALETSHIKYMTKAQRRRMAKRFIRDEVSRRRMTR